MRVKTFFILTQVSMTYASAGYVAWQAPKVVAQLYNIKQSNPDTTSDLRNIINEQLQDENLGGPIPYLKGRTPLRSESLPEMNTSRVWGRWFNFEIKSVGKERYASGYEVELIKSLHCNPDPFKGDCYGGEFYSFFNSNDTDFIRGASFIKKAPLSNREVPLAYGLTGYFLGGSIEWLYNNGLYGLDAGDFPIENVILANASNPDLKDPKGPNYNKPFVGRINQNLKVNMQLRRSGKWLWGTYFYDRGQPVPLKDRLYVVGSVSPDGTATLQEYAFDNAQNSASRSGTFKGKLSGDRTFSGSWATPNGSKTLPFSLQAP